MIILIIIFIIIYKRKKKKKEELHESESENVSSVEMTQVDQVDEQNISFSKEITEEFSKLADTAYFEDIALLDSDKFVVLV
jgi:hypothetical protein